MRDLYIENDNDDVFLDTEEKSESGFYAFNTETGEYRYFESDEEFEYFFKKIGQATKWVTSGVKKGVINTVKNIGKSKAEKLQERIDERVSTLKNKLPQYFDSVYTFTKRLAQKRKDLSISFLTQLRLEGTRLYNTAEPSSTFKSSIGSVRSGTNIRKYVKDRELLIDAQINRLVEEKRLKEEREEKRKSLYSDLFTNHFWITRSLSSGNLDKITDLQIEDALLVAEEYILYETNETTRDLYENKIDILIKEQQKRIDELEEENTDETDSSDSSDSSDGTESTEVSEDGIKGTLNKYKWYIGGALVLGVVGIIVIRKI